MSFHNDWLASLDKTQRDLRAQGIDVELPPASMLELQIEYLEATPGKSIKGRVPFQKRFSNPIRTYQGGILSAAMDDHFGPLSYITAGGPCSTLSLNTTYLKPFTEKMGFCIIEAEVLQKTKSFIFMRATVKSPDGTLIAHGDSHVSILSEEHLKKGQSMSGLMFEIRQRFLEKAISFYGPFLGAGVKLKEMSKDYRYAKVTMPLTFYNKNYMGTQFGGSLYSMVDPWYMLMLIKNLGKNYIVWDKGATIRFKKPGKGKVTAEFRLTQEVIDEIKTQVEANTKMDYIFKVEVKDEKGAIICEVDKVVYIRKKSVVRDD